MKMDRRRAGLVVAREDGVTEGDVEEISGTGDENAKKELRSSDEVGSGQNTLAFFGWIK